MSTPRIYTVEELRALPPPTEEQLQQRRQAVADLVEVARRIEQRLGRQLTQEELEWALDPDTDYDDWDEGVAK